MNHIAEEIALRAEGLVKDYTIDWAGRRWRALGGINFTVGRGRICGIVGPNGSGKSTILKILAGLSPATAGRYEIAPVSGREGHAQPAIGYLPEAPDFPPQFTGREILLHYVRLNGLRDEAAEVRTQSALERVGLAATADRRIGGFSKGMKQRLGLAQSILQAPSVLLLDEPASGLDPVGIEQLTDILGEFRREGATVLLTSHFLPQVEELCDDFVMLLDGRVLFSGDRDAVRAAGGLHRLYLRLGRST